MNGLGLVLVLLAALFIYSEAVSVQSLKFPHGSLSDIPNAPLVS